MGVYRFVVRILLSLELKNRILVTLCFPDLPYVMFSEKRFNILEGIFSPSSYTYIISVKRGCLTTDKASFPQSILRNINQKIGTTNSRPCISSASKFAYHLDLICISFH